MKVFITSLKKLNLFSILFWLFLWQLIAIAIGQPLYLPTPTATLKSLMTLVPQLDFWKSIIATLLRVIVGFSISIFVGTLLGIIAGHSKFMDNLFKPIMTIAKSTPVMSIIILALVWLKSSHVPIFTCIILCIPIIYTNVLAGVHEIDQHLIEMSHIYHVKRRYIYTYIIFPSLKPYLFSGMMVSVGFSWKSVVTAEVLSSPKYSIGFNLYATKLYLETAELFAWTIVIILLSIILEKLVHSLFERKVNK